MNKIVFLTYISRSGSTYLAKLLDEYNDIGVTIESQIPDGIRWGRCNIKNSDDLEKYLKKLYSYEKFNYWNIKKSRLKKILMNSDFPIKFNIVLPIILNEYFRNISATTWIYKAGYYVNYIKDLKKIFPEAKILHIIRDPRAIYSSQRVFTAIKNKKPITASVIPFTKNYNRITTISK